MSQEALLYVMTAFVIISAIALLIQMGLLFGMYKVAKSMQQKTEAVMPKVNSILQTADATLADSKKNVIEITAKANEISGKANQMMAKANEIMDTAKLQMVKLDGLMTDATNRARAQMDRAEMVLDDTVSRVHESVAIVHNGINKPLREISGVANGVRAAVAHLVRGNRPSVDQVTQDEEMFI